MILDASVVAKWFLEEEGTKISLQIREKYFQDEFDISVPDLIIYEIANTLRYSDFSSQEINKALSSIYSMNLFLMDPSEKMMEKASKIAIEKEITIYDATYVALADQLSSRFITADKPLFTKTKESYDVRYLMGLSF